MNFKPGDIVQYVYGNDEWVKNKYKFRVLSTTYDDAKIVVLQDIRNINNIRLRYKGDIITLQKFKLKKVNLNNSNKPEWF